MSALLLSACQREPESGESPTPSPSVSASAEAAVEESEPSLSIKIGSQQRDWNRRDLLAHPQLQTLTITDHSAYEDQEMTYQVVPLAILFEGLEIADDRMVEYQTKDGFSSSLETERLLNTSDKGSVSYLAIEPEDQPWPHFENRRYGPGPFYLVWTNPELSEIGREEWPFKLTGFRDRPSLEKRYPDLKPDSSVKRNDKIYKGYKLFIKNCFPCHKLNQQGLATFGPDLNYPLSPTEYMTKPMLKRYIRNPQSVRKWKNGKMPAFPEKELSDEDIDLIVDYLEHKAKTR